MTRRTGARLLLAALVCTASAAGIAATASPAHADDEPTTTVDYPGDPESESAIVAAEDERLIEVRTVGALASQTATPLKSPYRLATGVGVHARAHRPAASPTPSTTCSPSRRRRSSADPTGPTCCRRTWSSSPVPRSTSPHPGGLRLLLASDAKGFVSIVNYGGRLNIAGHPRAPARITSFDREASQAGPADRRRPGLPALDRRSGVDRERRAVDLGFWSGRTGACP